MRLLTTCEARFYRSPAGELMGEGPSNYEYWSRYLEAFDEVIVLARVVEDAAKTPGVSPTARKMTRADGPGVRTCALHDYHGPWQFARWQGRLRHAAREAVENSDAYLIRLPGLVGRLALGQITLRQKPYAVEVLADPLEALSPGTWPGLMRPLYRQAAALELKRACARAIAVHYVTQAALQRLYAPSAGAYVAGFSDATIDWAFGGHEILERRLRRIEGLKQSQADGPLRIGFVGSLAGKRKGLDVLIRSLALCRKRGRRFELLAAGEGHCAAEMVELARSAGIEDCTKFMGQLAYGEQVKDFLDQLDLFVLPSRAEGLPRALLEAMARGCPCIASEVGGVEELLAADDRVAPGDAEALAQRIQDVVTSTDRLRKMATRNFARAQEYQPHMLKTKIRDFLLYVREHSRGAAPRTAPCESETAPLLKAM
jgi:glycosyltransferase involved in cell wall biosynthesis